MQCRQRTFIIAASEGCERTWSSSCAGDESRDTPGRCALRYRAAAADSHTRVRAETRMHAALPLRLSTAQLADSGRVTAKRGAAFYLLHTLSLLLEVPHKREPLRLRCLGSELVRIAVGCRDARHTRMYVMESGKAVPGRLLVSSLQAALWKLRTQRQQLDRCPPTAGQELGWATAAMSACISYRWPSAAGPPFAPAPLASPPRHHPQARLAALPRSPEEALHSTPAMLFGIAGRREGRHMVPVYVRASMHAASRRLLRSVGCAGLPMLEVCSSDHCVKVVRKGGDVPCALHTQRGCMSSHSLSPLELQTT
jgi:hypothetical protein